MWINCPLNCLAIPGVLVKLQKGWPEANNVSTMGKGNEVIFRTPAQLLLTLTRGMGTTVGISSGSARGLWLTFVAPPVFPLLTVRLAPSLRLVTPEPSPAAGT